MNGLFELLIIGFALFGASVAWKNLSIWMEFRDFFRPYRHVDQIVKNLQDPKKLKSILKESIKYKRCKDGAEFFVMRSTTGYGYPIDINLREGTVTYYGDGESLPRKGRKYTRETYIKEIKNLSNVREIFNV